MEQVPFQQGFLDVGAPRQQGSPDLAHPPERRGCLHALLLFRTQKKSFSPRFPGHSLNLLPPTHADWIILTEVIETGYLVPKLQRRKDRIITSDTIKSYLLIL